jgi:hypothetical protein
MSHPPSLSLLSPPLLPLVVSLSSSRWNRGLLRLHILCVDRLRAGDIWRIVVGSYRSLFFFKDRYTRFIASDLRPSLLSSVSAGTGMLVDVPWLR